MIAIADGEAYEVVGDEAETDPVVIPDPISENNDPEVGVNGGLSLPCPGFAFILGLSALPLSRRLRRDRS